MKKVLCVIIAFCMICGLFLTINAIVPGESTVAYEDNTLSVMTKDMLTGEVTYSTFVSSAQSNALGIANPQSIGWCPPHLERAVMGEPTVDVASIIGGVDNRVRVSDTEVYPYSAVCYLEADYGDNTDPDVATAFMIGDNIAVTAAHCLYRENTMASEVKVWPGKDGYGLWNNPFGTAEKIVILAPNWGPGNYRDENDWAVIVLDENVGNETGWFGFEWQHADATSRPLTISGYPGENQYYQYTASDTNAQLTEYHILHRIDTSAGQSGSPIYNSDYIVYGIHIKEYGNSRNLGNRITLPIYNYLISYINSY